MAGVNEHLRLRHALYLDADAERAQTAAETLSARQGDGGAAQWSAGGEGLCYLEVWRLNLGDATRTRSTIDRLRDGWDDPDPSHGQNALCVLLLESMVADAAEALDADELVAEFKRVMDLGPPGQRARDVANMELAKLLETRGDYANASEAAYSFNNGGDMSYHSTMVRRVLAWQI